MDDTDLGTTYKVPNRSTCKIFKLISSLVPIVCKKQLYCTNMYSRVQYGTEVFGAKQLKKVQVIQSAKNTIPIRLAHTPQRTYIETYL